MVEAGTPDKRAPTEPVERRLYRTAAVGELLPAITRAAYKRRSPATAGLLEALSANRGNGIASMARAVRSAAGA